MIGLVVVHACAAQVCPSLFHKKVQASLVTVLNTDADDRFVANLNDVKGSGAVIDVPNRIVVTIHLPLNIQPVTGIRVVFEDGSHARGKIVYQDSVLGFTFIQVEHLPKNVLALECEDMTHHDPIWVYGHYLRHETWLFYSKGVCENIPEGRLPTVKGEHGLRWCSSVLITKKGRLGGLVIPQWLREGYPYYVPARFVREVLDALRNKKTFQPHYLNVRLQKVDYTVALDAGFLNADTLAIYQKQYPKQNRVFVVKEPYRSLNCGDVILDVNGTAPGWGLIYDAPRRGQPVRVTVLRGEASHTFDLTPEYVHPERSGVLATESMQFFFCTPFMSLFEMRNIPIGACVMQPRLPLDMLVKNFEREPTSFVWGNAPTTFPEMMHQFHNEPWKVMDLAESPGKGWGVVTQIVPPKKDGV